jgi:hypothetical protein
MSHPKLTEIIHTDFYNLSSIEAQLTGFNACYFCLGVSSIGKTEGEYRRITYDLTLHFGSTLSRLNPDMIFCYVSGAGTDSTESGRQMWARVKGKTENDLLKLPFKAVYNFRPGFIQPTKGLNNTLKAYTFISWMFPVLQILFPSGVCTLQQIGNAMISVTMHGYPTSTIAVKDIKIAASNIGM